MSIKEDTMRWFSLVLFLGLAFAQIRVVPVQQVGQHPRPPEVARLPWEVVAYRLEATRPFTVKVEIWANGAQAAIEAKTFEDGRVLLIAGFARSRQGCTMYGWLDLVGKSGEAERVTCLELSPLAPVNASLQPTLPAELQWKNPYLFAWTRYADMLGRATDVFAIVTLQEK